MSHCHTAFASLWANHSRPLIMRPGNSLKPIRWQTLTAMCTRWASVACAWTGRSPLPCRAVLYKLTNKKISQFPPISIAWDPRHGQVLEPTRALHPRLHPPHTTQYNCTRSSQTHGTDATSLCGSLQKKKGAEKGKRVFSDLRNLNLLTQTVSG